MRSIMTPRWHQPSTQRSSSSSQYVLNALAPDGTWMIVEPAAGVRIAETPFNLVFEARP
jgi:hypothetical protein